MALNSDGQTETDRDTQKASLRRTIESKLTSPNAKKLIINHLLPILLFLFLSIFIFRNIIGVKGVIIQGDLIYSPNLEIFTKDFYPMWNDNLSLSALTTLPRLLFYLPFVEIGFLFSMSGTDIWVMTFIFCEFLAGISMYYASRYLLKKTYTRIDHASLITKEIRCPKCKYKITVSGSPGDKVYCACSKCGDRGIFTFPEEKKDSKKSRKSDVIEVDSSLQNRINIASLVAGLAYMWSSYLLQNFLFPQHRFAYALAPFILLSLIIGLEKKKAIYIILTGFLWCLACADMHWTVYGAILLFSFILFHFVLEFAQLLPTGKIKAFKTSLFSHLKYTIILIASFLSFSAYWFLPGYLMGGTGRYPAILFPENGITHLTQTAMLSLISDSLLPMYVHTAALFHSTIDILNSSGMQNLLLLLGVAVFIFGMMALILRPKNRYVIFFSIFTLIILLLCSLAMFSENLNYWFMTKAPLSNWYGWVFKRPMIQQFLLLASAFLIGFSIFEIITRIQKSKLKNINLKKGIAVAILCLLLLTILLPKWPLATGDHSGWIKPAKMPDEFEQVNSWLEKEPGDFKVLWLPEYYGLNISWYPGHRINKDIAGLISSKPTYDFWGPAKQANGQGINFFAASIYTLNKDSLFLSNTTRNIGKFLAPLGIKYIVFHDDNATSWDNRSYKNADVLFTVLKHQDDLKLITEFGINYIFENKYYDEQNSSVFFTTSNDSLIFGGLGSLATLNSIPAFHPRDDGLIFGNQKQYGKEDISRMIDSLIFTHSVGLEEIAFTFADDKYFIIPFNSANSASGDQKWTKISLNNFVNSNFNSRGNFGEWEKDYNKGIAFTWSPGTIRVNRSLSDKELVVRYDFENDTEINDFKGNLTSNLTLSVSNNSASGDKGMMGTVAPGEQDKIQYAQSELFPLPYEGYKNQISLNLAAENVSYVQVKLNYYDAEKKRTGEQSLLTRNGTFTYTTFQEDAISPPDAIYFTIQILADQNPGTVSHWWIDDIRLYNLYNITTFAGLNMTFNVEKNDNHELFMRYLKSEAGGKINIYLDGKQLPTLHTYDTINGFVWEKFYSVYLTQGSHTMAIDNVGGFNAINLIAAVPESTMDEYYEIASDFLKDNALIYILEAESNFYFDNATISGAYGNLASSAKVLSIKDDGKAWLPVQILQSGNYSLCIKSTGGSPNNKLMASLGNNSFDLGGTNGSDFVWHNITNISLTPGFHNLNFSVTPPVPIVHESFEEGWNSTTNAPENWLSAQRQFSMSLNSSNRTDGEYSLMITTNSTEPFTYSKVASQNITLKPNNYYDAKIDVRTENMNNSRVRIMGYNDTSAKWENLTSLIRILNETLDWKEYNRSFFVPENISQYRVILDAGWVLNSTEGNATAWFDNFKIFNVTGVKNNSIDLVVLYLSKNNQTLENLFGSNHKSTIVEYNKIDATKYEIKVSSEEPFTLGFAAAYDEFWVAHVDGLGTINSMPLYSMLNSFFINKTGNFTVTIEYQPQQWFNIGASITCLSIIGSIGYLIWSTRRNKKKKSDSLIKND